MAWLVHNAKPCLSQIKPLPDWLARIYKGNYFNFIREGFYKRMGGFNEVVLETGKRVDSYIQINWGILYNQIVQYEKIEFPEVITIVDGVVKLLRGELSIQTKYENPRVFNLRFGAEFPIVIANQAAYSQGQNAIVEGFHSEKSFLKMDLRNFPELRNKVYSDLNLDPEKSYYELSKEMGFDLARFY